MISFNADCLAKMQEAAKAGLAPARRPKVNIHIHLPPNFSAFETVSQAVELAAKQGVGVLGVSNYYDYRVYDEFEKLAQRRGIFPIFGLEIIALLDDLVRAGVLINDPGNPGKMYICGKGITRFRKMTGEAQRLIGTIRRNDSRRMEAMIEKIEALLAERGVEVRLGAGGIIGRVQKRHGCPREAIYLQERHVAQAYQEAIFEKYPQAQLPEKLAAALGAPPASLEPVKVQTEIRSRLMKAGKPAFVPETFLNFQEAYRLILELGGIPCYPTLADGAKPICPYEQPVEKLIEQLRLSNIHCVELIPIRNQPDVLRHYATSMRKAGLVVTAGTEHNTLDMLPLEPTCVGGREIDEDLKDIFWEGACVVAAHQFLSMMQQPGFVDGQGRPNAEYKDAESRIAAFRRFGAAVIERYYRLS